MTLQVKILTSMMSGTEENGNVVINPFYKATEDDIRKNFEYAKEVYGNVFRSFLLAWYVNRNLELLPKECGVLVIDEPERDYYASTCING